MVSPELVARCKRGDRSAFEELVRASHRRVYSLAYRLVGDPTDAEDVAQDAYLRMFRGLAGFRQEAAFDTSRARLDVADGARRIGDTVLNHAGTISPSLPGLHAFGERYHSLFLIGLHSYDGRLGRRGRAFGDGAGRSEAKVEVIYTEEQHAAV